MNGLAFLAPGIKEKKYADVRSSWLSMEQTIFCSSDNKLSVKIRNGIVCKILWAQINKNLRYALCVCAKTSEIKLR